MIIINYRPQVVTLSTRTIGFSRNKKAADSRTEEYCIENCIPILEETINKYLGTYWYELVRR